MNNTNKPDEGKKKKSLYQEIDDFLQEELNGVYRNHHYKGGTNQVHYALSNALGIIRSFKEGRYWDRQKSKKPMGKVASAKRYKRTLNQNRNKP